MMNQRLLCSQCGQMCETNQAFCSQCGSALAIVETPTLPGKSSQASKEKGDVTCFPCPSCENLIPQGSLYCNMCGDVLRPQQKKEDVDFRQIVRSRRRSPKTLQLIEPKRSPMPKYESKPSNVRFLKSSLITFFGRSFEWFLQKQLLSVFVFILSGIVLEFVVDHAIAAWMPPQQYAIFLDNQYKTQYTYVFWSVAAGCILLFTQIFSTLLIAFGIGLQQAYYETFERKILSRFSTAVLWIHLFLSLAAGLFSLIGDLLPYANFHSYDFVDTPGWTSVGIHGFIGSLMILLFFFTSN